MISIGIRYLCGWSMATHPSARERAEWPPHPDRVYMALAAAHFETEGSPDEARVLKALPSWGAPDVFAAPASPRTPVTSFVPVNGDTAKSISESGSPLPLGQAVSVLRIRQPRTFPVSIPEHDTVYFVWPNADLDERSTRVLDALCRKVTAVGHSASLVQAWVEANPPRETSEDSNVPHRQLSPTGALDAEAYLRVPGENRFDDLRSTYENEIRPTPARWVGYERPRLVRPRSEPAKSVFDHDLLILRKVDGTGLGLESTLMVTEALRGLVMSSSPQPVPEWVGGHELNGAPSQKPHLAFLPLANVGHEHARGQLMGVALAIPKQVTSGQQREALSHLLFDTYGEPAQRTLKFGRLGSWTIQVDERESKPVALRAATWTSRVRVDWDAPAPERHHLDSEEPRTTGGHSAWATVTPIVLDRYPKKSGDIERSIESACQNVGLPKPTNVYAQSAPFFRGVPHARGFPPLRVGERQVNRVHIHALIEFEDAVVGPLLLGAGRYRGYGLCRPWWEQSS